MMCNKCGGREKHGRSGLCKPCKSEYNKEWYANNKAPHKANVAKNNAIRLAEFKALVDEHKSSGCADCGKVYPSYVMDFDHLEDAVKVESVAKMRGWSMARVTEEIAKCEVVCSNCHRERTHKRLVASKV